MRHFIILAGLLTALSASAEKTDIAAIVNDKPITVYDFTARKKMAVVLNKIDISRPEVNRQLDKDIMNILVEEELLNQYSKKVGTKVSEEEVDNAISVIEQRSKMPRGYMSQYMRELGVDMKSFRQQIRGELIKYNIINSLSSSVSVSPKELDVAVINSGHEDFDIEAWIFTAQGSEDKTLKQMEKLKKQFTDCNKVDERAYNGFASGERINRKLKDLEDKTRSVILDTKENHTSDIYQEDGKFKVALVCAKKSTVSGEELGKVKNFLINHKMSQKAAKFFKDMRARAYVKIMMNE